MVYIVILALLILLPGVPLAVGWWHLFLGHYRQKQRFARLPVLLLIIATVSFLWLMAGLRWSSVLGPDYSSLRYELIETNYLIDLTASGFGAFVKDSRRWWLIGCLGAVSADWIYLAVVNSAV
jgi:hypothetical protein